MAPPRRPSPSCVALRLSAGENKGTSSSSSSTRAEEKFWDGASFSSVFCQDTLPIDSPGHGRLKVETKQFANQPPRRVAVGGFSNRQRLVCHCGMVRQPLRGQDTLDNDSTGHGRLRVETKPFVNQPPRRLEVGGSLNHKILVCHFGVVRQPLRGCWGGGVA